VLVQQALLQLHKLDGCTGDFACLEPMQPVPWTTSFAGTELRCQWCIWVVAGRVPQVSSADCAAGIRSILPPCDLVWCVSSARPVVHGTLVQEPKVEVACCSFAGRAGPQLPSRCRSWQICNRRSRGSTPCWWPSVTPGQLLLVCTAYCCRAPLERLRSTNLCSGTEV
jgi:hypothetical protein